MRVPFIAALVQWAAAFPLAARIATGAAAAGSAAAAAAAETVQTSQSLVKLDVVMRAPLVQVAANDGKVILSADLGQFEVANEFDGGAETLRVDVSRITVAVGDSNILEPLDMNAVVNRPHPPIMVGDIEVSTIVPAIALKIAPWQIALVMSMVDELTTALPAALSAPIPAELKAIELGSDTDILVTEPSRPVPAQSSPEAGQTLGLKFMARVEKISLALVKDNAEAVLNLNLSGLALAMERSALGAMTLNASMFSLYLVDARPVECAFRVRSFVSLVGIIN